MPQSNSNLQSYAKLPAAKNNSPKIFSPASLHSLTQISQIPQFCTPGAKSHRCSPHPLSLMLTQIPQIPRFCTPGVKSHRGFTHPCSLRLTRISQIPLIFFDGVKSHRVRQRGRVACPSAPSTPISKVHTDSTRFNKK